MHPIQQHTTFTRIYAPIIIGIAILLWIFVTKPLYESYLVTVVEKNTLKKTLEEKEKVKNTLQDMKQQLERQGTGMTTMTEKVNRLSKKWDSADVMSTVMLNQFTLSNTLTSPRITIGNITTGKGWKLPSGLSLWTVTVDVSANTLTDMIEYITYLTQEAPYVFTIDEISLPLDTGSREDVMKQPITLSLSLGVYHYE